MRVYIVVHSDYERDVILGVYASRVAAERAKHKHGRHERFEQEGVEDADYDVDLGKKCSDAREWDDAHIEEHSVRGGTMGGGR